MKSDLSLLLKEAEAETTSPERLYELAKMNSELSIAVATSNYAPPELLEKLSFFEDECVKKAVVRNKNTPLHVLFALSQDYQYLEESFQNPIFSIIVLESIYLIGRYRKNELTDFVKRIIKSSDVSKSLLKYIISPENIDKDFAEDKELVEAARMHVNLYGEMQEGWHETARIAIYRCYYDFAENWYTLSHISSIDKIRYEKLWFLSNFSEFLPNFIVEYQEVALYIAKNFRTSIKLLDKLSNSEFASVREEIAKNPKTTACTLAKLSKDDSIDVRSSVANNFSTRGLSSN